MRSKNAEAQARWRATHPDYHRNWKLKNQYGLTPEDYDAMLLKQGGKCKNPHCGAVVGDSRGGRLHVDHCHKTGKVRGLLCTRCNRAIGQLEDNAASLHWLGEYVEQDGWE